MDPVKDKIGNESSYIAEKVDDEKAYNQDGVFIHLYSSEIDEDRFIAGVLSVFEEKCVWYIQWAPLNICDEKQNKKEDCNNETELSCNKEEAKGKDFNYFEYSFKFPVTELKRLKKSSKKHTGWKYILFQLKDGQQLPHVNFHNYGYDEFEEVLEHHVFLVNSHQGGGWFDVSQKNQKALTKTFNELNIFSEGSSKNKTKDNTLFNSPIFGTAYNGISKMTSILTDFLNPVENPPYQRPATEQGQILKHFPHHKNDNFTARLQIGKERFQISNSDDDNTNGFEHITCCEIPDRKETEEMFRLSPLSNDEWSRYKDKEGRINKPDEVNQRIFLGSVEGSLRKEVWKYQLGLYDWSKTKNENENYQKLKEEEYNCMKSQWKMFTKDQLNRFTDLSSRFSLIEKDVTRTDRKREFFEEIDSWGLQKLQDILNTYCMYNFDLGYVQGMSDLLAVILEVLKNESDAFWCFVGYMQVMHDNFVISQKGMTKQLRDLQILVEFYDPQLWDHLNNKDSSEMFFCFRWILIRFKREFDFENIQKLWEVFWTRYPCKNFHLVYCLALLDSQRSYLLKEECGFNEILKHINEMAEHIDLETSLKTAQAIYQQFATISGDLPQSVKKILDL